MSILFDEWHKINTQFTPYRPKHPNISPNPPTPTPYNHHSPFSLNSKFPKFPKFFKFSKFSKFPNHLSESCAIGGTLYAKRKGANLTICSYNGLPPPFHKEGERGWIVNIIGGIKPTLQAEDMGSAKLPP